MAGSIASYTCCLRLVHKQLRHTCRTSPFTSAQTFCRTCGLRMPWLGSTFSIPKLLLKYSRSSHGKLSLASTARCNNYVSHGISMLSTVPRQRSQSLWLKWRPNAVSHQYGRFKNRWGRTAAKTPPWNPILRITLTFCGRRTYLVRVLSVIFLHPNSYAASGQLPFVLDFMNDLGDTACFVCSPPPP
jgi:hypothetical protein